MKTFYVTAGRNGQRSLTGWTVYTMKDVLERKYWFVKNGYDFIEVYEH